MRRANVATERQTSAGGRGATRSAARRRAPRRCRVGARRRDRGRERDDRRRATARSTRAGRIETRVPAPVGPARAGIDGQRRALAAPAVARPDLRRRCELDRGRTFLPDLRRQRALAHEARAGRHRRAVLDAGRRMAEQRLARAMAQVDRPDPADGDRFVGALGPAPRPATSSRSGKRAPAQVRRGARARRRAPASRRGRARRCRRSRADGGRARAARVAPWRARTSQRVAPTSRHQVQLGDAGAVRLLGAASAVCASVSASRSRCRSAAARAIASDRARRRPVGDRVMRSRRVSPARICSSRSRTIGAGGGRVALARRPAPARARRARAWSGCSTIVPHQPRGLVQIGIGPRRRRACTGRSPASSVTSR